MKVVICGGGIIGTSCAYFLAKRNISCVIIEQEEIACAASGKAGGFLAKNWCESNICDDLVKLSYKLHIQLSSLFTDVDYRCVNTYSATVDKIHSIVKKNCPDGINWIDGPISKCSLLDTTETTSQVHPKKLSQKFFEEAKKLTNNATRVIRGTVVGIEFDNSSTLPRVKAVKMELGEPIEADKVVIAMGPWSYRAVQWFPKGSIPPIGAHRAHSIVLKVPKNFTVPADCLFLEYKTNRSTTSPEIYPRPDGTVYVSGFGDDVPLPDRASNVTIERWRCSQLRDVAYSTCSQLEASDMVAEQACFLPLSPDGVPLIGSINKVIGGYIATGHSCWGILNSTGTGFVMAELLATGKCLSLDLRPFDPNRFI